ncbi:hypothetical protein O181_014466 [Austropuccinia psidii MF-1]|uniref:Uncharacterized protein n=1 Tax=Austropuccinia psidii MF-1 TaxID=1389203 RepID=A0A9Q3BY62_9BASI|nr:hypothetical protein [Austropuccinia psidii MF-1]
MLEKSLNHAVRYMEGSFAYAKDIWHKSHATTNFKVGYLVLVSNTNLNDIKGCKNLKDSFSLHFFIKTLHGENAIEVEFSEELSNKHPTFPVSLVRPYESSDGEKFPLINTASQNISPIESFITRKITKVLKPSKLSAKKKGNTLLGTVTQLVKING